jgi:hypothetical protein
MSYFRSIAGRVVSCILYLIAGGFSGWLMLMDIGMSRGRPTPIAEYISLVGSLVLIVAAVIALFRFRATGYIALAGFIAAWMFYVVIFVASLNPPARPVTAHAGRPSNRGFTVTPLDVVVPLLLLGSLAYPIASIVGMRRIEP